MVSYLNYTDFLSYKGNIIDYSNSMSLAFGLPKKAVYCVLKSYKLNTSYHHPFKIEEKIFIKDYFRKISEPSIISSVFYHKKVYTVKPKILNVKKHICNKSSSTITYTVPSATLEKK